MKNQSMHKKLAVGSLACSILLASISAYAFKDTEGHPAERSINKLSSMGIINGYPSGDFKPNGLISRAEFAAVLSKGLRLPQGNNADANFVDVKPSYWAFNPIESVSINDFVRGYPGGYFYPNKNITRAEALTVITKASNVALLNDTETDNVLKTYPDSQSVPSWARSSVATAIKNGFFNPGTYLDANDYATRADVANYTDRLMVALDAKASTAAYAPTQPNSTTSSSSSTNTTSNSNTTTTQTVLSVVPVNTTFTAMLSTAIASDRSQVGDMVSANLNKPLIGADGKVVAPAGSEIKGYISSVVRPQNDQQSASVTITFNQLVVNPSKTVDITAQVNTVDGSLVAAQLPDRITGTDNGYVATSPNYSNSLLGTGVGVFLASIKDKPTLNSYLQQTAAASGVLSSAEKSRYLLLLPGDMLELKLKQTLFVQTTQAAN